MCWHVLLYIIVGVCSRAGIDHGSFVVLSLLSGLLPSCIALEQSLRDFIKELRRRCCACTASDDARLCVHVLSVRVDAFFLCAYHHD